MLVIGVGPPSVRLRDQAFAGGAPPCIVNTKAPGIPSDVMTDQSPGIPKRNWPLIWALVAVAVLAGAVVIGSIAMYVANFNLLEWME